jgi:CRISPR-associated protein Csb1
MANHLETVCVQGFDLSLVDELDGLPYVKCIIGQNRDELVATSLSEGHRLASYYFLNGNRVINNTIEEKKFGEVLLADDFRLRNLAKKTHPLPAQWWNVFSAIFRYDPNSLVHGILFPAMGIKLPRVLTATLDAFGADRIATSGVKFDKISKKDPKNPGQAIFSKDEESASEIRATFTIDLSLIRSFGRGNEGLNDAQKQLILGFALWKIKKLIGSSFRFRSECDLELTGLQIDGKVSKVSDLAVDIETLIKNAGFQDPRVTEIYWDENELFKPAKDIPEDGSEDPDDGDDQSDEDE